MTVIAFPKEIHRWSVVSPYKEPIIRKAFPWASYQIHKMAGCACTGNAGSVFPATDFQRKPLVSDPDMHHGTCATHVPWCMSGSLTRNGGENVPGIPGACATRNCTYLVRGPCRVRHHILQNAHKSYWEAVSPVLHIARAFKSQPLSNINATANWGIIGLDNGLSSIRRQGIIKSPVSRFFTQPFIQTQIKENIKAPRHWPLCGEFTDSRWIPRTKGQ